VVDEFGCVARDGPQVQEGATQNPVDERLGKLLEHRTIGGTPLASVTLHFQPCVGEQRLTESSSDGNELSESPPGKKAVELFAHDPLDGVNLSSTAGPIVFQNAVHVVEVVELYVG